MKPSGERGKKSTQFSDRPLSTPSPSSRLVRGSLSLCTRSPRTSIFVAPVETEYKAIVERPRICESTSDFMAQFLSDPSGWPEKKMRDEKEKAGLDESPSGLGFYSLPPSNSGFQRFNSCSGARKVKRCGFREQSWRGCFFLSRNIGTGEKNGKQLDDAHDPPPLLESQPKTASKLKWPGSPSPSSSRSSRSSPGLRLLTASCRVSVYLSCFFRAPFIFSLPGFRIKQFNSYLLRLDLSLSLKNPKTFSFLL